MINLKEKRESIFKILKKSKEPKETANLIMEVIENEWECPDCGWKLRFRREEEK